MSIINVGGLATGLDTNQIVDQLVKLEQQRAVGSLQTQQSDAQLRQTALQNFNTKVLAFLSAVDKLKNAGTVLTRAATSSNPTVLTATADPGALAGSTTITVGTLARVAIASAGNGKASPDASIATGSGSFAFQVGSGAVQTLAIDATTTLAGLAAAINQTNAGVTASVVNIGTSAAPDYRLRIASDQTGTSGAVSIVTDNTTLGVAVTQTAENASFTVSGFTDPITRETNTVNDIIPGVTLNLIATGGPVTVTVGTDAAGVASTVEAAVNAFNDVVTFVASQSTVTQDTSLPDRSVTIGPLALDQTVKSVVDSLHHLVSTRVDGLSGNYTLLADVGVTTNRDGTLSFDSSTLTKALTTKDVDVAALFGGSGVTSGVADRLSDYLSGITGAGGVIALRTQSVAKEISDLQERIAEGQRNVDAYQENLKASFASLEVLVSTLKAQGAFLQSAFAKAAQ